MASPLLCLRGFDAAHEMIPLINFELGVPAKVSLLASQASSCATSLALTASLVSSLTQNEPTILVSGLNFTSSLVTNSKTSCYKQVVRSIRVHFHLYLLSGPGQSALLCG